MTSETDRRAEEIIANVRERVGSQRRQCTLEDYVYDKSQDAFWDTLLGMLLKDRAVDASIPQALWRVEVTQPAGPRGGRARERLVRPSLDIMRIEADQTVEAAAWWPGRPRIIHDWSVGPEGLWPKAGCRLFNTYRPAPAAYGSAAAGERWAEHVRQLWPDPDEHNYFFDYCAHAVQRPGEKCNVALVLSGTQGIGKDAALYPLKAAVGRFNAQGIDPSDLFSPYRPWLQSVLLVIDEARASKDEHTASAIYNILKPLISAPPDLLPLNNKFEKLRYVVNCLRVIITTNDRAALFIPEEDRRYFMMHSALEIGWAPQSYFTDLFRWFDGGGAEDVAAWLAARDLQNFNPKEPPMKTGSWAAVAETWGLGEDDPTDGALDALGRPLVVFSAQLVTVQFDGREEMRSIVKSPRKLQHRMERCGYALVPRPRGDGLWMMQKANKRFRSRLAFIRAQDAPKTVEAQRTAVNHALNEMVDAMDPQLRLIKPDE